MLQQDEEAWNCFDWVKAFKNSGTQHIGNKTTAMATLTVLYSFYANNQPSSFIMEIRMEDLQQEQQHKENQT